MTRKLNMYWQCLEHQDSEAAARAGDAEEITGLDSDLKGDRRTFLKLAGFAFAGSLVSGCVGAKTEHVMPYLVPPEEVIPGRSYWYAATCGGCASSCGILTKNRDGRPVKIEGNKLHPMSKGGLCAVGQASTLGLYDSQRLSSPTGKAKDWVEADQRIRKALEEIKSQGGQIRFLSQTITSPSLQHQIDSFLKTFKNGRHDCYDPLSVSALLDSHEKSFGKRVLPHYKFDKAKLIFSFAADFLGSWISPVEFTNDYTSGRTLKPETHGPRLSRHVQLESVLSLTGSNADERHTVSPSDIPQTLALLLTRVAVLAGKKLVKLQGLPGKLSIDNKVLDGWAKELWNARGQSLVVCGLNDLQSQLLTNSLNEILGNYGSTLDIVKPSYQRQGSDEALQQLLGEMNAGKVSALFLHNVNPAYDSPLGATFLAALTKVKLVVSFAERLDETARHAHFVCPDHHPLESWSDSEPVAGVLSLSQPAVQPLGKTRSILTSLTAWQGKKQSAREVIADYWEKKVFKRQNKFAKFQQFWDRTLHDGVTEVAVESDWKPAFDPKSIAWSPVKADAGLSLVLYPKLGMLDGRHAHNAWLHELPDPITKAVWDNYACLSPAAADKLHVKEGTIVKVSVGNKSLQLPVVIQPGQHDSIVAVALGYGRRGTDRFAKVGPQWLHAQPTVQKGGTVGENAAPFIRLVRGLQQYSGIKVEVKRTSGQRVIARTQLYHTLKMPESVVGEDQTRHIVAETNLASYAKDPSAGIHKAHGVHNLWNEDHKYEGHHWGVVIDLNACTGCSSCVISCQAENNIPVVGRDEVARGRDMAWLRIDRYYAGDNDDLSVVHQPMMCQHCDNAPCEVVCPVLATVHSAEGINQQVYNRCVGTRYCANNCPYKVRRFNWFKYEHDDERQNLALNPDVTVRSRGVMEKCSLCYQRIAEAKAEAGNETLRDGDIQTACQQSCPAGAIVFGDMNDPKSKVAQQKKDGRHYLVLEELNVRPSVGYMTKVRNRPNDGTESDSHSEKKKHGGDHG